MKKDNPRILLIEDNPIDITRIIMKLHNFSKDITCVTTGESALSIFKGSIMMENPYDILVTDILLPGIDGKELIKEIRDIEQGLGYKYHIKIIAMSADEPSRHVLEACKIGAGSYLKKPVSAEKIKDALLNTGFFK